VPDFYIEFFYLAALEISISIAMCWSVWNVKGEWQEAWSKGLTIAFLVMQAIFLLFFTCLFTLKCKGVGPVERMEAWTDYVGILYEGLLYKEHWANRLVPVIFMVKRIALSSLLIYFDM
jgi:hypothetical protein